MEYLLLYNTGSFKADGGGYVDLAIELARKHLRVTGCYVIQFLSGTTALPSLLQTIVSFLYLTLSFFLILSHSMFLLSPPL